MTSAHHFINISQNILNIRIKLIFTETRHPGLQFEHKNETIPIRIESDMILLNRTFQGSEVYSALKQMYPLKSPGLNGMPPLFFQHFWPSIGHLVTKTVLNFLNSSIAPPMFNDTHVVLIPKNKDPKNISDYRPISLCNVIFKLASKVIANRLK